jgi:hypothetical protein
MRPRMRFLSLGLMSFLFSHTGVTGASDPIREVSYPGLFLSTPGVHALPVVDRGFLIFIKRPARSQPAVLST